MKEQINFRLEAELKNELNTLAEEFAGTKDDFLVSMLSAYRNNKDNNVDIDLSKYDNTSSNVKQAIEGAIRVIMSNVDNMSLNAKQEQIELIRSKKEFVEEQGKELEVAKQTIENLKLVLLEKDGVIEELENNYKELSNKVKEFHQVHTMTEIVIKDNSELTNRIKELEEQLKKTSNALLVKTKDGLVNNIKNLEDIDKRLDDCIENTISD